MGDSVHVNALTSLVDLKAAQNSEISQLPFRKQVYTPVQKFGDSKIFFKRQITLLFSKAKLKWLK